MNWVDWAIAGTAAVGLIMTVRGCLRGAASDAAAGLFVGVVAAAAYFFLFSLTRTAFLGMICLAPFAFAMWASGRLRRTAAGTAVALLAIGLLVAAGVVEELLVSRGNALLSIEAYRSGSIWRFDEPRLHLKGEPFVQGIPEMIDKMAAGIPGSDHSVRLIFSQSPFPGHQYRLDRLSEQDGGNWYYNEPFQMKGWLCPALFKFFPRAPRHIYVRAEAVQAPGSLPASQPAR